MNARRFMRTASPEIEGGIVADYATPRKGINVAGIRQYANVAIANAAP
jgi:hypothetical protein